MSVANKKAKLLDDGWYWKIYDDGSGHLESADSKSYFSFDYATQEYVDLNKKWQFMTNYPDSTPMDMFKAEMERDWNQDISAKIYNIYELICLEQDESEIPIIQM